MRRQVTSERGGHKLVAADVANTATPHLQHVLLRSRDGHGQGIAANAAVSPSNVGVQTTTFSSVTRHVWFHNSLDL
jgi:hypothetical protein